jgi:hypothetical protein
MPYIPAVQQLLPPLVAVDCIQEDPCEFIRAKLLFSDKLAKARPHSYQYGYPYSSPRDFACRSALVDELQEK